MIGDFKVQWKPHKLTLLMQNVCQSPWNCRKIAVETAGIFHKRFKIALKNITKITLKTLIVLFVAAFRNKRVDDIRFHKIEKLVQISKLWFRSLRYQNCTLNKMVEHCQRWWPTYTSERFDISNGKRKTTNGYWHMQTNYHFPDRWRKSEKKIYLYSFYHRPDIHYDSGKHKSL